MIKIDRIEEVAFELMAKASIEIPADFREGIKGMADEETEELSKFVLQTMIENWEAAELDRRPMCADTGLPRYYVKAGNEARIEGGFVALEKALRSATARATQAIPLRPNRVHPISRKDLNNNVGQHAPEVQYAFEPDGDWLDITTVHKGGCSAPTTACCSRATASTASSVFSSTSWCSLAAAAWPASRRSSASGSAATRTPACASARRPRASGRSASATPIPRSPRSSWNSRSSAISIGMGPMGFVGHSMVIDCNIEIGYTHTGGMPISVHTFCLSSRRATARIFADSAIEYRADPKWFTPYYRREGIQ